MRSDGRTPPWPHAAASAFVAPCALTAVVSPAVSAASLQGVAARDSVVNQLLALMDGVANLPVPTFVIALTNRRELVDGAVLRPGRLEVQVAVGKPDETGREAILRIHAEKSAWRPCARPALRSPAWPELLTCMARASHLPGPGFSPAWPGLLACRPAAAGRACASPPLLTCRTQRALAPCTVRESGRLSLDGEETVSEEGCSLERVDDAAYDSWIKAHAEHRTRAQPSRPEPVWHLAPPERRLTAC